MFLVALVLSLAHTVNGFQFTCPDTRCSSTPCDCDEPNLNCIPNTCHSHPGCNQCLNGYFKKSYNDRCVSCSETFGPGCMHCTDFLGCQQCSSGYQLTWDNECYVHYCDQDPTPQPTPRPTGVPTKSPTCDIRDTKIRLLFLNGEYDSVGDEYCYNYQLFYKNRATDSTNADCGLQDLTHVAQFRLDFSCDEDSTTPDLSTFLQSTNANSYVIEDNVLIVTPLLADADDDDNYIYTFCFDASSDDTDVSVVIDSIYCVEDDNTGIESCDNIFVSDVCGESDFNNDGTFPIDYIPVPGTTYDLESDDNMNGTGNFTLRNDTIVVRGWWIKECMSIYDATDDAYYMKVIFDDSYIDESIFFDGIDNGADDIFDRPILLPAYDRFVMDPSKMCGELQGRITGYENDAVNDEFILFVDLSLNPIFYLQDADFDLLEGITITLPELEDNGQNGNTRVFCTIMETGEEWNITTSEDMSYIYDVIEPMAEENNQTLFCVSESDSRFDFLANFSDYNESNFSSGAITGDGTSDITFGDPLTDSLWEYDFNNTLDTGESRRRLGFFKKVFKKIKNTIKKVVDTVKAVVDIIVNGLPDKIEKVKSTTITASWKDSFKNSIVDCEWEVYASAGKKDGFTIRLKSNYWIPKRIDEISGFVRAEVKAGGSASCTFDFDVSSTFSSQTLKKKEFSPGTKVLFALGPVVFTFKPFIEMSIEVDTNAAVAASFESSVSGYVSASAFVEFRAGWRRVGGIFVEFTKGIDIDKNMDVDFDRECSFEITAGVLLVLSPGVSIGIWGINGIAFAAIFDLPRFNAIVQYPAVGEPGDNSLCFDSDSCTTKTVGGRVFPSAIIKVKFEALLQLSFRVYIPTIRLFGLTLFKGKLLHRPDQPVLSVKVWEYSNCGTYGWASLFLGLACCDPVPQPTPRPTPAPVTPSPTTPRPTRAPTMDCFDSLCSTSPCDCDEVENCIQSTCHSQGCDQCQNGYFKQSFSHHCIHCQQTFGPQCLHCSDYIGCQQCSSGYQRVLNQACGLWECIQ